MTGWPKAVVFDLDGTLIDSLPDLAGALNELMAMRGLPVHPPESVARMIGKGAAVLVQRGFSAHGVELAGEAWTREVAAFLDLYEPRASRETRLFPGVAEVLRRYADARVPMAVCTNKPTAISRQILDDFGWLASMGAVVGGDFGPPRKPAPDLLLATLDLLGVAPSEALMVGDSASDVDAARAAGVSVIAVEYGYTAVPAAELGADLTIADFAALPAAVDQLRKTRHERA